MAMDKADARRLAVISAAGAYDDPNDPLLTRLVKPLLQRLLRDAFADAHEMDRQVQASGTDWTIVRPPQLTNGGRRAWPTRSSPPSATPRPSTTPWASATDRACPTLRTCPARFVVI